MEQNNIIRNADRYQQGMSISGKPQTIDVDNLLNQQRQEEFKGAFPLEPYPLQAITTKLEKVVIDFKDIISLTVQLKHNPVITKDKSIFLDKLIKKIKRITSDTVNADKILDNIVE